MSLENFVPESFRILSGVKLAARDFPDLFSEKFRSWSVVVGMRDFRDFGLNHSGFEDVGMRDFRKY